MIDAFRTMFNLEPFNLHEYFYSWKTGLLGLHVTSDALIALVYYSIPIALFFVARQRKDMPFKWGLFLFVAFIMACGTTHLLEIWTFWHPTYWLLDGMKAITALVSVFTAIGLVFFIPKVLATPGPFELQRLNEELQVSQARVAGILDIASDAIISIDANQHITLFNRAAEKVFGYTAEEILGQSLDLLLPQRFAALHHRHISNFNEQNGNTRRMGDRNEIFGRRKDGTEFPAEASISKLEVAGETIFTAFLRDITDRKQVEVELQEQQQFLRQVIDSNPNPTFVKDWNGRFTLANQALAEVYNTSVEDIIGKTDTDFCPDPTDAARFAQADRHVMQTLQPLLGLEETFTNTDGTIRCFQSTKTPLLAPDGQTRYVLGVANDITTLKQTEAALQQKTEELETFFLSAIDLLCIADIEGRFLRLNPEWERTLGYGLPELEGKHFLDFVHPDDLEATRAANIQASEQPLLRFVNRYRHQDGSYRWLEWRSVPRGSYIYAAARDITDRKQAEQVLQEREAFLRAIGDNLPNGFLYQLMREQDGQCRFTYVSAGIERVSGLKPEAVLADSNLLFDRLLEEDRFYMMQKTDESAQNLSLFDVQVREHLPNAEIRWLRLCSTPRRLDDGRVIWDGIQLDINDLKQTEEHLRQSEERWHLAILGSNDGIWDHNLQTNAHYLSPRCMEMIGYEYYEIDTFDKWIQLVHPDDVNRLQTTFLRHVEQHLPNYACEYRMQHKDGSYKWLLARGQVLWNEQETPLRAVGSLTDITDRKHAEEKLRQSENTKRAMIQAIPDLLIRMRDDGTQLELINRGCVHFIGAGTVFPGSNVADILPSDVVRERLYCAKQALKTGDMQLHEYQLVVDGQLCFEEARIVPLQANEVLMMVRDITDRKHMEQALRDSETRFRTLIEDLQVGVVVQGAHAEMLLSNSKALEMLGLTEAQLLGKTSFDPSWNVIHDDGSPFPGETHPVPQAIATGKSVRSVIMGVYRPQHNDRVWLLVDAEPQLDAEGKVQQVVCTFSDISDRQAALQERERAKAELQKREQEFRALVENAPDIIMRLDYDCRYLYINPTVERHSGIPVSAFINKTIEEFGAPASLIELWQTNIHQAFATGQEQRLEFEISTNTGTIYYATRIVPEIAADGSVQSVLAIARDISDYVRILQEREQAETLLRDSEARLRLALKAAKFGTWEYNFVTNELLQNNISEIYGLEPGQSHKNQAEWLAQVHPGDREWVQTEFDRAIRDAGEFHAEFRIFHPNGTEHWARSTGAVVHNQAGQPLYAYGIAADITDRKLAEVEQQSQQAFLRQVIDVVPNNIFVKDREGRLLVVNHASATIHGTSIENMIGKRETDFNPNFSLEQLEEFLAINQQVMETRQPRVDLFQTIMSATGETRWYQTVISPLTDIDGQVTGIVGATTDVTGLKQAEQALQQAKEAAETANRTKSIFLANMSHELRTPLNVILGFVQVMQRDAQLTIEQQENLHIIRRSGDHLLSLINDVLDLSKIEAGHVTLDESSVDLFDVMRSLEQMFHQRADIKGLQLHLELASDLPQYITVDVNKLRQVLINLLGNAIKFTEEGSVTLRVSLASRHEALVMGQADQWDQDKRQVSITFEVADTGIGIALSELESIFNAFVQTQAGKISPDGTGLGLTISRKFVQMMGGDIAVQSVLGHGSTFAFTIPVHLLHRSDASITPASYRVIGLAPHQPTYRILVVDDRPENRKLLVELLTQIGLDVREAVNGQDAVTQWQQWQPHLIYMDIRMPLLNGYEATQQIRATANGQSPVIIALTAQASKSDRTLALSSGCNDYLTKPFQEDVLFNKMAEHLGLKYLCAIEQDALQGDVIPSLNPSDLSVMPSSWISSLCQAARLCDDNQIEDLIEQIPADQQSLIRGLRQLVQTYNFKQILALTTSEVTDDDA
jgi:PAS domain S-box-containing protein